MKIDIKLFLDYFFLQKSLNLLIFGYFYQNLNLILDKIGRNKYEIKTFVLFFILEYSNFNKMKILCVLIESPNGFVLNHKSKKLLTLFD